jgi:hypothetical protein
MRLYNWEQWNFKLKDSKIYKNQTHVYVNASKVGTREGIELRWSWGFGLNEVGAWQEHWWQANLRLVNWCQ